MKTQTSMRGAVTVGPTEKKGKLFSTEGMTSSCRHKRYWEFGEKLGHFLQDVLPKSWRSAAATCRIQMRGKHANGNVFGLGVVSTLMTYGEKPRGIGGPNQPAIQMRGNFVELTDDDAADIILECFGLSVGDVLGHFGMPKERERYSVDLADIIAALRPELLTAAELVA